MKNLYNALCLLKQNLSEYLIDIIQNYVSNTIDDGNYDEMYDFANYVNNTLDNIKINLTLSYYDDIEDSEYHYNQAKQNLSRLIDFVHIELQKVEV